MAPHPSPTEKIPLWLRRQFVLRPKTGLCGFPRFIVLPLDTTGLGPYNCPLVVMIAANAVHKLKTTEDDLMRKIMVSIVLVGIAMMLGGCQGLTSDSEQNIRKYSRISELNRRMLADDIEAMLLLDRPGRLSRYNVPQE